jgi:hypothetical protein
MSFVKSSSGLPGTIEDSDNEVIGVMDGGEQDKHEDLENNKLNGETRNAEISDLAEELVDKLECFKVGQEKISSLKMLAVKIETLFGAWTAGALTAQYLMAVLTTVENALNKAEKDRLSEPPWTAYWDRYSTFLTKASNPF